MLPRSSFLLQEPDPLEEVVRNPPLNYQLRGRAIQSCRDKLRTAETLKFFVNG